MCTCCGIMYTYSDIGSRYVSFYIHRYVYIEYICMQHAVQRLENDSMNTPHTRERASARSFSFSKAFIRTKFNIRSSKSYVVVIRVKCTRAHCESDAHTVNMEARDTYEL